MSDVTKEAEVKPKAPTIEEYYRALHVVLAASDLARAIVQKGVKSFPQAAFEALCAELCTFRGGLPPSLEGTKNPIYSRMRDIEDYFLSKDDGSPAVLELKPQDETGSLKFCPYCGFKQPAPFENVEAFLCPDCNRAVETHPRPAVFVQGTSGNIEPLDDPEGNRRFWPVKIEPEPET